MEGIYAEGEIYQAAAEVLNCPLIIWTEFQHLPFVLIPKQCISSHKNSSVLGLALESLYFKLFEIVSILDTVEIEPERAPCLMKSKIAFISRANGKKSTFEDIYIYLKI